MSYTGLERRRYVQLSDEDFERIVAASVERAAPDIAERAADIMQGNLERKVGKSAINIFLWVVGAATLVLLGWLGLKGAIK